MSFQKILSVMVVCVFMAAPAIAGDMAHHSMDKSQSAASKETVAASTAAFEAANEKMHHGMAIEFSGIADVDFVRGMIPHHQGAIDMAKVQLKYGKDPEIQKLAKGIIQAQEQEIAQMKSWLQKNDPAFKADKAQ